MSNPMAAKASTPSCHPEDIGTEPGDELDAADLDCGEQFIDDAGIRHVGAVGQSNIDARMDYLPPEPLMDEDDGQAKTGPKGVVADYKRAQANVYKQRLRQRILAERAQMRKTTIGFTSGADAASAKAAAKKKAESKRIGGGDATDDDSSDFEDSDDEAAMARFRDQRRQEAVNALPTFGTHERVTLGSFASSVKKVNPLVTVVCHLYQNHIEGCVRLNFAFEALAGQFPYVKFCRLRAKDAMPGFREEGLPTVLIYRDGELVKSYIRFTDALPARFTDRQVAEVLAAGQYLQLLSVWMDNRSGTRDESAALSDSDEADDEGVDATGFDWGF